MSTIVFVHAHPDDEGTGTAGTMIRAAREGHRVVVVYCTDGDPGDVPDDLAPGETVVSRRRGEAEASARITGTARIAWLGYGDSGMTGWAQNDADGVFSRADLGEAARRLADLLDDEEADVVVERVVIPEEPAKAVLDASGDAQLIVVGSRGRGGFTGLLLGSTSQKILHQAERPVMVVRE